MPLMQFIPDLLASLPNWVYWKSVRRDGNPTKVPYSILTGKPAKSNDPATWTRSPESIPCEYEGAGFVFAKDGGLYGIDLDNCILSSGELAPWAAEILERFENTYAEVSPSGRGIKIWAQGNVVRGRSRRLDPRAGDPGRVPGVEIYGQGRYFAFTGNYWSSLPKQVERCDEALAWLLAKYWPEGGDWDKPAEAKRDAISHTPTAPPSVLDRAERYLSKIPGAISGQGGHNRTFHAAGVLVHGFGLSVEDALPLLLRWNAACEPPWTELEIERKLREAAKSPCSKPIGWLRDETPEHLATGPVADFSELLESRQTPVAAEVVEAEEEEWKPKDPGPFDATLCDVPGFLGEFIRHDLATARFSQPELSLAAGLCTLSVLTGRKVRDQVDTRTNLFAVGLAPAGAGKASARKTAKAVLTAAGAADLIGPERIGSHSGLLAALEECPALLFLVDELGDLMAQMKAQGAKSHLANIESVLKSLYSAAGEYYKGDAYANVKHVKKIDQPHMTLYGTTTPGAFWGGVSVGNLEHGLIPRFLIFEGKHVDPREDAAHAELPSYLASAARAWFMFQPGAGNLANVTAQPITVGESGEAKELRSAHDKAIRQKMQSDKDDRSLLLWARANEKAAKLALLRACSRWVMPGVGSCPRIEVDDFEWAKKVANYLTRRTVYRMFGRVHSSEEEARKQRILGIIGDGQITWTQLTRRTQELTGLQRRKTLEDLVESGLVKSRQELSKSGRGRPTTTFSRPNCTQDSVIAG